MSTVRPLCVMALMAHALPCLVCSLWPFLACHKGNWDARARAKVLPEGRR
jgi:hypothetical protein